MASLAGMARRATVTSGSPSAFVRGEASLFEFLAVRVSHVRYGVGYGSRIHAG
jgi:hypothetical protein